MPDLKTNRFAGMGTAAEVAAEAVPDPATVVASAYEVPQLYLRYETDTHILKIWNGSAYVSYDLDSVTGALLAANNLSDLVTPATARTNLGLAIGTNVQAYSANLTSYAGVAPSANVLSFLGAANYAAMKTQLSLTIGTDVQAYNANLTTFAGIAPSANVQTLLGAADYAAFRTSLGLVIGTNVQAYDAELAALAGLTSAADKVPYFTGSGTAAVTDLTSVARTLINQTTQALMRSTGLGLGTSAVVDTGTSGTKVALTDGANTWSAAQTDSALATFSAGANLTPASTPATNAVGYLGAPQNTQNGTYTTVMSDAGKHIYHTSGSTHTWTIDSNANVAYPIGTVIAFVNESGGGNVTIAITSDTLRWGSSTGSRTLAANGTATALKVTSTAWRLTGDGIT